MSRHGTYDPVYGFLPEDDFPEEPKPQTNADRIRAMSDEELAKYLAWLEDEQACYQWKMYGDVNRISEWLDWLKSPVEDSNDS